MTFSPALVERILAEQKTGSSRRARRWRAALPLGAAVAAVACLIALVLAPLPWRLERVSPGIDRGRPAGRASGSALRPSNRQADSRVLSEALADATAASWDLARTTSKPAARLGRQVLESATQVENPSRAGSRRRSCRFFVPRAWTHSPRSSRSFRKRRRALPCFSKWGMVCRRVSAPCRPPHARPSGSCGFRRSRRATTARSTSPPRREPEMLSALDLLNRKDPAPARQWLPSWRTILGLELIVLATAARAGEPVSPARELQKLIPPDASVVLTVEDLRGQVRELLASRLAAEFPKLPTVKAWFDSEKYEQLETARDQIEGVLQAKLTEIRDQIVGDAVVLALRLPPDSPFHPSQARGILALKAINALGLLARQGGTVGASSPKP